MKKNNWSKETLLEVRKIANKTSTNLKNFSDNDLKQFLNLFIKATNKVKREKA